MKIIKILVFFCFLTFSAFADELSLTVDKKTITEADVLYLTIHYTGDKDVSPNLDDLKENFKVVSNSISRQYFFTNGKSSQSKKWKVGLKPIKKGKLKIKPIKLANLISNSVEIEVTEVSNVAYAPDYQKNPNSLFFKIEQKINVSNPYIQQQTLLFVNVYDTVGLQDGLPTIDEESKKDWIIVPLTSQPSIKQDVVDNQHANIITYVFAVFPQKSGRLALPKITFDGYYIKNSTFSFPNFNDDLKAFGIDFNHVFGQQIPVRLKTEEKFIDVKAIPADYSAKNWLPVTNLDLSASWSARNGFKVGEAVSRNIFLKASGMTESMLPQISFKDGSGFRQYPEKPEITEEVINGEVVTTAKYNNVYIPTESGNITIPEIKIDWFDVKENEHKIATIPEETILVLPNPVLEQNKVKDNNKELSLPLSNTNKESVQTEEPLIAPDIQKTSGDLFASFISMFYSYLPFVLIFLLFVFLFIALVIKSKKSHKNRNAIISALRKHDYKKAKDALLFWAKDKYYPADINNFNDISNIVKDADFTEQLSALNKFLYSTEADFFDSSKFISVLKKIDKIKRKEHKKSEVLPNLYD